MGVTPSHICGEDRFGEGNGSARRRPCTKAAKTGLLIIRAWVEEGSSEPLRADVRATTDLSAGIERTVTLARAEQVRATVQAWLAEVLGETAPAEPSG